MGNTRGVDKGVMAICWVLSALFQSRFRKEKDNPGIGYSARVFCRVGLKMGLGSIIKRSKYNLKLNGYCTEVCYLFSRTYLSQWSP